ncbi:MAG: energy-coupling factor transporter transmembrane protein EcfT [Chloroflexi bacterium]|nr:energy-coupling factor transporter transmembrane protein EcfT [Chloroflexota bacterium]MBV9896247.1 energy-coupling factor transporter transmembrane protein EcfT [Chloroflexota bacterium]
MRFLLFYETDSFLHRVNPLTKLAFTVVVMVVLTVVVDPITPLAVALLGVTAIVLFGGVPLGQILRTLRPFGIVSFGLFWTTALFYASTMEPFARWGPLALTKDGVAYGVAIMLRILAIFAVSLLFTLTTDPTAFLQALVQQAHVSSRFGYGIIAAYRFVPLFDGELASIRAAHRIRGVPLGGGVVAQYRRLVGHMVPLLAGAIRHAERVALAMDARGFGAVPDRTYFHRSVFGWRDVVFATTAGLVLALLLFGLHAAGWLGETIPPFVN